MARVLLVSFIAELLQEREQILRAAGYEVTVAQSCASAAAAIRQEPFDVAVLGFNAPEEERNQLARDITQVNPAAKIIMMYFSNVKNTELADAIIQASAGPQDILRAVNHILNSQSREQSG